MARFGIFPRTSISPSCPDSLVLRKSSFTRFWSLWTHLGNLTRLPYSLRLWRFSGGEDIQCKHSHNPGSPSERIDNDSRRLRLLIAEQNSLPFLLLMPVTANLRNQAGWEGHTRKSSSTADAHHSYTNGKQVRSPFLKQAHHWPVQSAFYTKQACSCTHNNNGRHFRIFFVLTFCPNKF
ncbi:uncharacterized protein LOC123412070 [Hordeum vulgare subsp. vulgare]|uniref:uncharacterized protein LOC123412070 n=1 Tax=Hordeum vulgare subsp. vulgare TaxID=112509 RepID=UPI001D1A57A9|nr:uncharacterized protein LOC123412070 [Hordeum vulgare subsp. vulgare]